MNGVNLAPFGITILAFQQGKIDSTKILDYMLINKFISAYIHIYGFLKLVNFQV